VTALARGIGSRLGQAIGLLLAVVVVVFFLIQIAPGDAALYLAGEQGGGHCAGGEDGEPFDPVLGDQQRVLELGGTPAVEGHGGPGIVPEGTRRIPEGEHGLDRERHPRNQQGVVARVEVVLHLEPTVELGADSVADELPDDTEAVSLGVALDGVADGVERLGRPNGVDAQVHGDSGLGDEAPGVVVDVADQDGHRGIAVDPVEEDRDVDVDDVAVGQWSAVGDAVADDLVDRGAHRLGVAAVVERARIAAPNDGGLVDEGVDPVGGDAGLHGTAGLDEDLGCCRSRPAHPLDLVGGAHRRRPCRSRISTDGVGGPADPGRNGTGRAEQPRTHGRFGDRSVGDPPPLTLHHPSRLPAASRRTQRRKRLTASTTQAGRSLPSISTVARITVW